MNTWVISVQKLFFSCLILIKPLHYFCISVIIIVPKSIVTNTGKNTLTEADYLLRKSSVFTTYLFVFLYKLMEKLIDVMEDDDDVQNVWHNWEE